jgi:hypothetical protein
MLRMMIAAALCLVAVPLAGCAGAKFDQCRGAETRRAAYVTAITAADAYALSGRPMPQAVVLGRQAAVTAIAILDARCPRPAA